MAFALRSPYRRRAARAGAAADDGVGARESDGTVADETATSHRTAARPGMTRVAAARGAWAVGSVLLLIARLIRLIVGIAVLIIVAAIILRVVGANASNSIVRDVHDVGNALVGPFKNVFSIKNAKVSMAVNWGLAAVVYLIVGGFIARFIARLAPRGVPPAEPVR